MKPLRYPILLLIAALLAPATSIAAEKKSKGAGTHGAIAFSRDSGSFGYAVDQKAARDAKLEALKQCGHERCEVVATFKSGCAALASTMEARKPVTATGVTRQEAQTRALRKCGAGCEARVWACTK